MGEQKTYLPDAVSASHAIPPYTRSSRVAELLGFSIDHSRNLTLNFRGIRAGRFKQSFEEVEGLNYLILSRNFWPQMGVNSRSQQGPELPEYFKQFQGLKRLNA